MEALNEQFGTAAEFEDPKGGIFLWVKLPDNVDTHEALPGRRSRPASRSIPGRNGRPTRPMPAAGMRLCFASPTHERDPRGRRGAGRGLPQRIRRAGAQRECGEARADIGRRVRGQRQAAGPSQRNTSAIRSSRTIETLPLPASIWAT